jgi:Ca-activated chloride channel family protein
MASENDGRKDYYAVLGLTSSATLREIRRAYRALARKFHPDTRSGDTATELFHEVQVAYAVLSDPRRRRAYDRRMSASAEGAESPLALEILLSRSKLSSLHEEQVLYALLTIEPTAKARSHRVPVNLCLVVDRSTSMQGARLDSLKQAAHNIVDELSEKDSLAIVAFHDRAEVVVPSQTGVKPAVAKAKISAIQAGGGTEILRGLKAGLDELDRHHSDSVVSHLILLTDGQTYGDDDECLAEARRAGARRIGMTAMGIGDDWNDALLDAMAEQNGGRAFYIASPSQVRSLLQQRVRGLSEIFAHSLRLEHHCAEDVWIESQYRVTPYLDTMSLANGPTNLGALRGGVPLTLLLELGIAQKAPGEHHLLDLAVTATIPAKGVGSHRLRGRIDVTFTATEPPPEPVPPPLVSALSRVTLYRMQARAWAALESGDVEEATRQLEMVATRFFDLGEQQLARAAMLEAGRIAKGGGATSKGRKEIKYGTRGLTTAPRR